jgi:hypothetical protein
MGVKWGGKGEKREIMAGNVAYLNGASHTDDSIHTKKVKGIL